MTRTAVMDITAAVTAGGASCNQTMTVNWTITRRMKMHEYIDRDSFLSCKRNQYCMNCERRKNSKGKFVYAIGDAPCRACGIGYVLDDVEDFPAADVVERCKGHKCPKQKCGKWTSVFGIGTVCNQCGYDIEEHGYDVRTDGEPNFCPNCGARMEES